MSFPPAEAAKKLSSFCRKKDMSHVKADTSCFAPPIDEVAQKKLEKDSFAVKKEMLDAKLSLDSDLAGSTAVRDTIAKAESTRFAKPPENLASPSSNGLEPWLPQGSLNAEHPQSDFAKSSYGDGQAVCRTLGGGVGPQVESGPPIQDTNVHLECFPVAERKTRHESAGPFSQCGDHCMSAKEEAWRDRALTNYHPTTGASSSGAYFGKSEAGLIGSETPQSKNPSRTTKRDQFVAAASHPENLPMKSEILGVTPSSGCIATEPDGPAYCASTNLTGSANNLRQKQHLDKAVADVGAPIVKQVEEVALCLEPRRDSLDVSSENVGSARDKWGSGSALSVSGTQAKGELSPIGQKHSHSPAVESMHAPGVHVQESVVKPSSKLDESKVKMLGKKELIGSEHHVGQACQQSSKFSQLADWNTPGSSLLDGGATGKSSSTVIAAGVVGEPIPTFGGIDGHGPLAANVHVNPSKKANVNVASVLSLSSHVKGEMKPPFEAKQDGLMGHGKGVGKAEPSELPDVTPTHHVKPHSTVSGQSEDSAIVGTTYDLMAAAGKKKQEPSRLLDENETLAHRASTATSELQAENVSTCAPGCPEPQQATTAPPFPQSAGLIKRSVSLQTDNGKSLGERETVHAGDGVGLSVPGSGLTGDFEPTSRAQPGNGHRVMETVSVKSEPSTEVVRDQGFIADRPQTTSGTSVRNYTDAESPDDTLQGSRAQYPLPSSSLPAGVRSRVILEGVLPSTHVEPPALSMQNRDANRPVGDVASNIERRDVNDEQRLGERSSTQQMSQADGSNQVSQRIFGPPELSSGAERHEEPGPPRSASTMPRVRDAESGSGVSPGMGSHRFGSFGRVPRLPQHSRSSERRARPTAARDRPDAPDVSIEESEILDAGEERFAHMPPDVNLANQDRVHDADSEIYSRRRGTRRGADDISESPLAKKQRSGAGGSTGPSISAGGRGRGGRDEDAEIQGTAASVGESTASALVSPGRVRRESLPQASASCIPPKSSNRYFFSNQGSRSQVHHAVKEFVGSDVDDEDDLDWSNNRAKAKEKEDVLVSTDYYRTTLASTASNEVPGCNASSTVNERVKSEGELSDDGCAAPAMATSPPEKSDIAPPNRDDRSLGAEDGYLPQNANAEQELDPEMIARIPPEYRSSSARIELVSRQVYINTGGLRFRTDLMHRETHLFIEGIFSVSFERQLHVAVAEEVRKARKRLGGRRRRSTRQDLKHGWNKGRQ